MRVNVWLVVVFVSLIAHHLIVVPAAGGPLETAPVTASIHEDAVVLDPPTPQLPRPVNVRVYRSPEVTSDVLRAALNVAEVTFAAASVDVVWKVCGPAECQTPPSPAERLVRLVRSPKVEAVTPVASVTPSSTRREAPVYWRRFTSTASLDLVRRLDIDHPTLLGRTIAHEIGHLLLATNTHGTSGLMRELWSPDELLASRADDWALRPVEAAAIRQRLTISRGDHQSSAS